MNNLKNTKKWNELFILNSLEVSLSRDLVNLEMDHHVLGLSDLVYRRRKAVIQNQLEDLEEQQNNLRNQINKG